MLRRLPVLALIIAAAWMAIAQQPDIFVAPPGRPQQLSPATNPTATTGPYSVTGTVVNAATGEPVARALVHLNMQTQQIVMSGPDGRFQFENLPEGTAAAFAQKPGFFTPQEIGITAQTYPIIRIGKDATEIKLKLYPTGAISGHITAV